MADDAPTAVEMDARNAGDTTLEMGDDEEVVVERVSNKFVDKFAKLIYPYYALATIVCLIIFVVILVAGNKTPVRRIFYLLFLKYHPSYTN